MNALTRGHRFGLLPVLAVVALASSLASCSSSASDGAKNSPSSKPTAAFAITSTLVDGSTLTEPTQWEVKTGTASVDHVDFLIDNKVTWTEMNSPYFFNDDGNVLAPWLLSPGKHVLTARATNSDGSSAKTVATVQIGPATAVPAGMTGTFQRKLGKPAPGVWKIYVRRNGLIRFDDPEGSGGNEAVTVRGPNAKFWGPADWLEPADRRGGFCDHESPGSLTWHKATNGIAFSGRSGCSGRDSLFVGTWTRTS